MLICVSSLNGEGLVRRGGRLSTLVLHLCDQVLPQRILAILSLLFKLFHDLAGDVVCGRLAGDSPLLLSHHRSQSARGQRS